MFGWIIGIVGQVTNAGTNEHLFGMIAGTVDTGIYGYLSPSVGAIDPQPYSDTNITQLLSFPFGGQFAFSDYTPDSVSHLLELGREIYVDSGPSTWAVINPVYTSLSSRLSTDIGGLYLIPDAGFFEFVDGGDYTVDITAANIGSPNGLWIRLIETSVGSAYSLDAAIGTALGISASAITGFAIDVPGDNVVITITGNATSLFNVDTSLELSNPNTGETIVIGPIESVVFSGGVTTVQADLVSTSVDVLCTTAYVLNTNPDFYPFPVTATTSNANNTAALTTYTFSSQAIGTKDGMRTVIVSIYGNATATRNVNTVTIAGVTATILQGDVGNNAFAIAYAHIDTTADTGSVVVTFSAGMNGCFINTHSVYYLDTGIAPRHHILTAATTNTLSFNVSSSGTGGTLDNTRDAYMITMRAQATATSRPTTSTIQGAAGTELMDQVFDSAINITTATRTIDAGYNSASVTGQSQSAGTENHGGMMIVFNGKFDRSN